MKGDENDDKDVSTQSNGKAPYVSTSCSCQSERNVGVSEILICRSETGKRASYGLCDIIVILKSSSTRRQEDQFSIPKRVAKMCQWRAHVDHSLFRLMLALRAGPWFHLSPTRQDLTTACNSHTCALHLAFYQEI
jgi:hypothetical protein